MPQYTVSYTPSGYQTPRQVGPKQAANLLARAAGQPLPYPHHEVRDEIASGKVAVLTCRKQLLALNRAISASIQDLVAGRI